MPEVSVIINCFNGEKFLAEAIRSVYSQTFSDWEIIFWDNASQDRSVEIASAFDNKTSVYVAEKTTSLGEARKKAVTKAKGKWLAFLDVDDIWLPHNLEIQMAGLSQSHHILAYGGVREVRLDLSEIRDVIPKWQSGDQLADQLSNFEIPLISAIVRRSMLEQLGLNFDPRMQASEEYNLFMQLLAHGTAKVTKDVVALYRVHESSLTHQKLHRLALERRGTLAALAEANPDITATLEFQRAARQGDYYEASHHMAAGKSGLARSILAAHTTNFTYWALYLLTFWPFLWKLCHDPVNKRRLTNLLRIR